MYNLTVDELHTYYVIAGSAAVLVHNDGTVPNAIIQRVQQIQGGEAAPRLNPDGTADTFEVRSGTPAAVARKWGGAQIYDLGDGENRYRVLVNNYGDIGWVDQHNYSKITPYVPSC
jgi:hypothetical protein